MTATNAKEWRKAREQGIEITLPVSGHVASIRPIEVDFFLRVGHIPDALADTVNKLVKGDSVVMENPPTEELEKSKEFCEFLNELVHYAFVSPKVADPKSGEDRILTDDEITVDDIPFADKVVVYRFFCRPANVLRRFRDQQAESVAPVEPARNNGRKGKRSDEDQPVGQQATRNAGPLDSPSV